MCSKNYDTRELLKTFRVESEKEEISSYFARN